MCSLSLTAAAAAAAVLLGHIVFRRSPAAPDPAASALSHISHSAAADIVAGGHSHRSVGLAFVRRSVGHPAAAAAAVGHTPGAAAAAVCTFVVILVGLVGLLLSGGRAVVLSVGRAVVLLLLLLLLVVHACIRSVKWSVVT